jgi:RHS repeat-associated protein
MTTNTKMNTPAKTNFFFSITGRRLLSALLTVIFLLTTGPAPLALAENAHGEKRTTPPPPPTVAVRKGAREVTLFKPKVSFSDNPTDLELTSARVFLEPLVPMHSEAVPGENQALAKAIVAHKLHETDDISVFTQFMAAYPKSRWLPSLELNIAQRLFDNGYLSEAFTDWKSVWQAAKGETALAQKSVADEAVAQLVMLQARIGHTAELESTLAELNKRPLYGSVEARVKQAREGLFCQKHRPGIAFKCGPFAVNNLLNIGKANPSRHPLVEKMRSSSRGTNLAQVKSLADKVGLKYQVAKRSPDAAIIVPAVMHWKLGHFASITAESNGRYHVQDGTFGDKGNMWLTAKAIAAETDGYCLVPAGQLPAGWKVVNQAESGQIWGKGAGGPIDGPNTGSNPKEDPGLGGGGDCPTCSCKLMAHASVFSLTTDLNIKDSPVGYKPPVGPSIDFLTNYTNREGNQPTTFTFTNFGQDWCLNWVSYLTLDGSQNATVRVRGGGYEIYNYTVPDNVSNPYPPNLTSQAVLTVASVGVYERLLPDGSIEVFNQPDGTGRIFMTQIIDPQGNAASIHYDVNFRVTSVTDAIGQASAIAYVSNTTGNAGFYKVASITDPFGRSATFTYDTASTTFLLSITDVIGLVSQFAYDTGSSFIDRLTTPYGTTSFYQYTNSVSGISWNGLNFAFPDGTQAVIENWVGEGLATTYYWDREEMMQYPLEASATTYTNFSHCKTIQFMVSGTASPYTLEPVIDFFTLPLDTVSPTQYSYAGESSIPPFNMIASSGTPTQISRSADAGPQNYYYQNNPFGHVTQSIDPVGRTFNYFYAANNVDLLEKRQTQGTNNDLNGKWEYNNNQHLPTTYIDGSGQKSLMTYNSVGELTTLTDANSDVWALVYDANGYLTQIDGPLPGNNDITTFTYDGYGRLYTVTDSEGYTLAYNYDNADRITQTLYPDGTTEQVVYDKLDAIMHKDRIGRWTQSAYTSMDQIAYEIDPLGRKTQYAWCACGSLSALTDPAGNTTSWEHDLEGRVIQKNYPDTTFQTYSYDALSLMVGKIDALNQNTSYIYNVDNTLNTVSYNNEINYTAPVYYTWDPNYERLSTIQNGWGTYTYTYNPYITDPFGTATTGGGMLYSVANSVISNSTAVYTYDALGRTTNRQINGAANSDTWTYDAMSRVTGETNTLGSFAYHYVDDVAGSSKGTTRLASINYPNSQVTNFSWYPPGLDERLQGISNMTASSTPRSQFNYAYDSAGEITRWAQQNASNTPVQYALGYDLAGQLTTAQGGSGSQPPSYANQSYYSYDLASNRTASQNTNNQTVRIGGTKTTGNTLTITVQDSALSGGSEAVSYTVLAADTLTTMTAALAAAITADTNLQLIGINATSSGTTVTIKSASPNITTYAASTSGGATETLTLGVKTNAIQNVTVNLIGAGYQSTLNDVLHLTVYDAALTGGNEAVTYTVPANGSSLTTIASGLAAAINADAHLSTLGVTATSASAVVSIKSASPNLTTYKQSVTPTSATGTETLTLGTNVVGNLTATVGGTITTGDVLGMTIRAANLPGGQEGISYKVLTGATLTSIAAGIAAAINADTNLQAFGVTATSAAAIVTVTSSPTYTKSITGTETITLGSNVNGNISATVGGTVTVGNILTINVTGAGLSGTKAENYTVITGDSLTSIAAGLAAKINADASLQAIKVSATSAAAVVTITYTPNNYPGYLSSITSGGTESMALAMDMNGSQAVIIGGTKTTSDSVTLTVLDAGLAGGQEPVTYNVLSGDTLTSITSGLTAAINADAHLATIGVTAASAATVITVNSNSPNITSYTQSTSSGATETVTLGINPNGIQTAAIGGTKTTGNTLTLTVCDAGLATGQESVNYTVLTADTLSTIAAGLVTAINADANLSAIGVTAASVATVVNIKSTSLNATTYTQSTSSGATESITLGVSTGVLQANFNHVNELVSLAPGGAARYQGTTNKAVKSATTATQLVSIKAAQPNETTYVTSLSHGGTETFTLSTSIDGVTSFTINGPVTTGDVLTITAENASLTGGQESVSYTVLSTDTIITIAGGLANAINKDIKLPAIGLSATSTPITISGYGSSTTYKASTNVGATEAIILGPYSGGNTTATFGGTVTAGDVLTITVIDVNLPGGQEPVSYTVSSGDTLGSISTGFYNAIQADTNLQSLGIYANAAQPTLNTIIARPTYTVATNVGATETIALGAGVNGNASIALGGTKTTGDTITLTTYYPGLTAGKEILTYTVLTADTMASIVAAITSAINGDAKLQALGLTSANTTTATLNWSENFTANPVLADGANPTSVSAVDGGSNTKTNSYQISVAGTTYASSLSGGATETIKLGANNDGNIGATIGGTITVGDALTLTAYGPLLAQKPEPVSYTAQTGDTSSSIAAGLALAINSDTILLPLGVSATSSAAVISITASTAAQALTYDANGNLTNDGTNTYMWDVENRLIQITYPSGYNSQFTYDPFGRCAAIYETSSGTTKQFIWCADRMREARDGTGSLLNQYFPCGQTISGSNYFYTRDHLGSVRELTDSSGNIQAQYSYDPYGKVTQLQGSLASDFQYAGYYFHAPSGLNLAVHRAYDANLGRWINRDPILSLIECTYVHNRPTNFVDPMGTFDAGPGYGLITTPVGVGTAPVGFGSFGGLINGIVLATAYAAAMALFRALELEGEYVKADECQKTAFECMKKCRDDYKWDKLLKVCPTGNARKKRQQEYRDCMEDCWHKYQKCIAGITRQELVDEAMKEVTENSMISPEAEAELKDLAEKASFDLKLGGPTTP